MKTGFPRLVPEPVCRRRLPRLLSSVRRRRALPWLLYSVRPEARLPASRLLAPRLLAPRLLAPKLLASRLLARGRRLVLEARLLARVRRLIQRRTPETRLPRSVRRRVGLLASVRRRVQPESKTKLPAQVRRRVQRGTPAGSFPRGFSSRRRRRDFRRGFNDGFGTRCRRVGAPGEEKRPEQYQEGYLRAEVSFGKNPDRGIRGDPGHVSAASHHQPAVRKASPGGSKSNCAPDRSVGSTRWTARWLAASHSVRARALSRSLSAATRQMLNPSTATTTTKAPTIKIKSIATKGYAIGTACAPPRQAQCIARVDLGH